MPNLQKISLPSSTTTRGYADRCRHFCQHTGTGGETFDSAGAFLARASTCRAFCLLVDFHLGDITGVELARQLAADGFKFPIILMTGSRDASIESQAIAVGGVALLYKPFPEATLIDAIKETAG